MRSDTDPIVSPPTANKAPFIPIDPFLGHHQHWPAIRKTITNSILESIESNLDTQTAEKLERYLNSTTGSTRSLLLESSNRLHESRLLAQISRSLDESGSTPFSVTYCRHQPRISKLPLIVRKTGIELSATIDRREPPPANNDEIFKWFRSVLNRLPQGAVIIWDAIDLAWDDQTDHSWFWLTSPFPTNVRLIMSAGPGVFAETCKARGITTVTPQTSTSIIDLPETAPLQDEIVGLLECSRGGRSEAELAEILSLDEVEISGAITLMSHLLERNDQKNVFLSSDHSGVDDRFKHREIADWLRAKPKESDAWLWEFPWQLTRLEEWDEIATLFSQPSIIWRWWTHYRADIVEVVRNLVNITGTPFHEIMDRARTDGAFRPHHALAYAAILASLQDHTSALQLIQNITDSTSPVDSKLHLQLARRRAIEYARDMGDVELAWKLHELLENEVPTSADFRTRGQWSLLKADLLIRRKDFPGAMESLQSLEDESDRVGQPWFEAESLHVQAEIAIVQSNNAALSTIDSKLLAHARNHGWDHVHLAPLRREIQRKLGAEDWPSARSLSLTLQEIAARLADIDALGESLGTLAVLENREGHYTEMITLLAAKERLCREAGDLHGVIDLLLSRAVAIGFRLGDPKTARSLAEEALRWSADLNDKDRESKAKQLLDRLSHSP